MERGLARNLVLGGTLDVANASSKERHRVRANEAGRVALRLRSWGLALRLGVAKQPPLS